MEYKKMCIARTFLLLLYLIYEMNDVYAQSRILSFQSCHIDTDCFENSFCYTERDGRRKCRCKESFILTPFNKTVYECLPVVGYDDTCILEIQCQVKLGSLGTCDENENVCKCINDAHLAKDKMCHQTVPLGKVCQTDSNCLLSDGSYGFCVSGKCVCNFHEHAAEGENRCIASSYLNGECAFQENCVQPFANCYGGLCKCIAGYVESENSTRCLVAASSVGDTCIQTIQCSEYVKGSFCYNNTCVCQSAHHGYGNECVSDAKLGERCNHDKECIITADLEHSVSCINGICSCVEGVSDKHSYGCILRSSGQQILPFVIIILCACLLILGPH